MPMIPAVIETVVENSPKLQLILGIYSFDARGFTARETPARWGG